MLKVVIADDEERICQLIRALIDWKSLSMEIVGVAHNGLEACALVREKQPDILITDIRMPGCSGMELIGQVKEYTDGLEIIVISGHAHFEYAQQAIKFGVGDYLLKPINKKELTATLEKLKERICRRMESEQDKRELQRRAQQDVQRMRESLPVGLFRQEEMPLSMEILQKKYHLQCREGLYQAVCVKMDCERRFLNHASSAVLMEKVREVLEQGLRDRCLEMVMCVEEFYCIGVINFEKERRDEIRRMLKSCLSQMELQKGLFSSVTFSMSIGNVCGQPEGLKESMREAVLLIQDRIVKGTGRLFEHLGQPSPLKDGNAAEKYLREMTRAAELLSTEKSDEAVAVLKEEIQEIRDAHGYEILELVYSAAEVFSAQTQMENRTARLEEFRRDCEQCRSVEELLSCMGKFQSEQIAGMAAKRENDTIRPIRNAKQYIQNHYSEPITQEEVSNEVGLSAAYFSVLFKKTEGEGFAKYLIRVRIEQAKILLRETNLPVTEVCRKVGYNDLKHFTHTFEKAVGVKPATYRKLYG